MFMHRELMFTALEYMFIARKLMFTARKYKYSRCKETISVDFPQIIPLQSINIAANDT